MTHPSVLILGTDALLAAVPATPVQLMHACLRAGYAAVVPASWGDELIAAQAIQRLASADGPIVQCSCPAVARRLSANAEGLAPMMFCSVAPPVATAMYVRTLYTPHVVEITYAGTCPSGSDSDIDARMLPDELLETLRARGIDVLQQPTEFDSVLPPDRRRFFSEPGGVPHASALQRAVPGAELVELGHDDFAVDLAQHLLANSRTFISLIPAVGCACAGAPAGSAMSQSRARVRDLEPPRASSPVVEHTLAVSIERSAPEPPARPGTTASSANPDGPEVPEPRMGGLDRQTGETPAPALVQPAVAIEDARRRSPVAPVRAVIAPLPHARAAGRQLPRAYVARRRSSPRGMRQSAIRRAEPGTHERQARWVRIAWIAGAGVGLLALLRLVL